VDRLLLPADPDAGRRFRPSQGGLLGISVCERTGGTSGTGRRLQLRSVVQTYDIPLSERLLRSPGVPDGPPGRPIRLSSLVPSSVSQNLWFRCHRSIPVTPGLSGTPLRRRSRRNTCGRGQVVRSVPLGAHAPRQPFRRPGRGWGCFRTPTPSVWRHHPLSSPGGSP